MTDHDHDYSDTLTDIATSVFEQQASDIPPPHIDAYPDCWESCEHVISRLTHQDDIPVHDMDIVTVMLPDEFQHYVVVLTTPTSDKYVIDPTFGQFSSNYDTPVTVAETDTISHAIVQPASKYLFAKHLV